MCFKKLNLPKVFLTFAESIANQAYSVMLNRTIHFDIAVSSKSLINDAPLKEDLLSSNIQLSPNQLL